MKRSRHISLLVLGTAAVLAGCSDNRADIQQHRYANQQDCTRDWGDQSVCSPRAGGGYMGPRYFWNHGGGAPVAVMPDGSERVMRNGALGRGLPSVAQSNATVAKGARVGGGSSVGTASVSRGGFGASAHGSSGG